MCEEEAEGCASSGSPLHPHPQLSPPLPPCIQLDGMSVEHYRAWQREHAGLKGKLVQVRYILYMRYIKGESPPHRITSPPISL